MMVGGVTRWPDNCDPRDACFCVSGFAPTGATGWKFFIRTTGALSPWTRLNTGYNIEFASIAPPPCRWAWTSPSGNRHIEIVVTNIPGWENSLPPDPTVQWDVLLTYVPIPSRLEGNVKARFPDPVADVPDMTMAVIIGPPSIPNPVELSPVIWDAPVGPL